MAFCHSLIVKNSAPYDIPRISPIQNGDFTVDIRGLTIDLLRPRAGSLKKTAFYDVLR